MFLCETSFFVCFWKAEVNSSYADGVVEYAFYLIFKISSAEQFKNVHNFDNVANEGCMRPDKYCDTVGLETPIALAISVLVFPDCSISCFKFLLIISSKESFIIILLY